MATSSASVIYEFDGFRVDPERRLIFGPDRQAISSPSKNFDTLLLLIRNRGRVIGKEEMMAEIWPDTIVEENNLNKNISALRRALGESPEQHRFIVTVPGRGYKFVAQVNEIAGSGSIPPVLADCWNGLSSAAPISTGMPEHLLPIESERPSRIWFALLAIATLAGLSFIGFYMWQESEQGVPISSVAVLPFVNAGGDPELEYLADGMSESLIDRLSELPNLKVISRRSSFKYRDENTDVQEVAQKLGVQAIVTGRISRRDDDLNIRVELIDARTNKQIWGEQFNRRVLDVLTIESEIPRLISGHLRLKLTGEQQQQLAKTDTVNPEAYDLLLKAQFLSRKGGTADRMKALAYYQQAVAADPNYAIAHARLSTMYQGLIGGSTFDPNIYMPKARAAAQRALELDENLSEAHLALAIFHLETWDWAAADDRFVRAIELNPNSDEAHRRYSYYLSTTGRHEQALAAARRAVALDPLSLNGQVRVGIALLAARRYNEALAEVKEILELDANMLRAHVLSGYVHQAKGMFHEAIASYQEAIRLGDKSPGTQIYLGAAHAQAGERSKALSILKQLETSKEYVSPCELSIIFIALNEREKAFESLEKAYAEHDLHLQFLNADFSYEPLRDDQRFHDLVRRVGLPN